MPSGIAGAGWPAAEGREEPGKLPQETQSSAAQQTAPPDGSSWPAGDSASSATTPNCDSACGVATSTVRWF